VIATFDVAFAQTARIATLDSRALPAAEAALPYFRQHGPALYQVQALAVLSWIAIFRPHLDSAPLIAELDAVIAALPPGKTKAWALVAVAVERWRGGDRDAGLARAEAGFAMHLAMGNPIGLFRSVMNFGETLHHGGETGRALELIERIAPQMRAHYQKWWLGALMGNAVSYHLALGQVGAARAPHREAVRYRPHDRTRWQMGPVENAAELLLHESEPARSALLLGFVEHYYAELADPAQTTEQMQLERIAAGLAAALPADEIERLRRQGATLSFFEAEHIAGFAELDKDNAAG
jgi:hypothetical protein